VVSSGGGRARVATHHHQPASSPAPQLSERVLAEEPSMGVACRTPNSIACDRVRLGVTLRRPAVAVEVTLGGRSFKLDDPEWSGPAHNGRRTRFAGALQPAGLINGSLKVRADRGRFYWIGTHPVFARVAILVNYGRRVTASTTFTVELRPGWG
jgi:hypothetical protein